MVQTNLLNGHHPCTVICPVTTNVQPKAEILRIHLKKGEAGLEKASDVIVDQIRAIDNRRFRDHLGVLSDANKEVLLRSLRVVVLE